MITSLLLGDKKNLLIGGAVVIGLIALVSSTGGKSSQPSLNGTNKKKPVQKKKPGTKKTATLKV